MVSVRTAGTAGFATRRCRDNRPSFPGLAVWVDAVAEIEISTQIEIDTRFEIDAELFGLDDVHGHADSETDTLDDSHPGPAVPIAVDAWSPDYRKVWRPLSGTGPEPRPGLLVSVVRAGVVVAYPTPLPDPPTGALARALARLERPEPAVSDRPSGVLPVVVEPAPPLPPRRTTSPQAHTEIRVLVGKLVEVLAGRRATSHAASWTEPAVRGRLRTPRFARTTTVKSVRLSESGDGIEAMALLRDGGRTHAVALRFDRGADSRWRCTALQTG